MPTPLIWLVKIRQRAKSDNFSSKFYILLLLKTFKGRSWLKYKTSLKYCLFPTPPPKSQPSGYLTVTVNVRIQESFKRMGSSHSLISQNSCVSRNIFFSFRKWNIWNKASLIISLALLNENKIMVVLVAHFCPSGCAF